jgi:NDP-sugar pyrophosphorylase family protein
MSIAPDSSLNGSPWQRDARRVVVQTSRSERGAAATKQAVILAAGLGSRLRPLTDRCPKPLVPVHGTPILHNTLVALGQVGVTDATIVVGYRKEAIQQSCGSSFAGVDIAYIESPVFESTGSAYSLWLARETLLHGDALLLEGDVIFESGVLARLVASQSVDVAAVAPFDRTMSGSAVTLSQIGLIQEFRMNQTSADLGGPVPLYKTMNLFRLAGSTLRDTLVPELDRLIATGGTRAYVEQLMARLISDLGWQVATAQCGDLKWFEIDSEADLQAAELIFVGPIKLPHAGFAGDTMCIGDGNDTAIG